MDWKRIFKDSKKYTDLFLFVDKLNDETKYMIENNKSIDVSIGFDVEYDFTPGEFNGEKYDVKQIKITLDHTAILPGSEGRASFPDGIGIGADSNINKGGDNMPEDKLADTMERLADAKSDLKDATVKTNDLQKKVDEQEKTIVDLNKRVDEKKIVELEKGADELKGIKDKSEEDSKKEIKELKDKVLKIRDDDKMEALIKKMDAEQLTILLDEMGSSPKKLPGKKDPSNTDADDPNEHLADKALRESYEKKTGQTLRRGW